jgi:hypothetical protein
MLQSDVNLMTARNLGVVFGRQYPFSCWCFPAYGLFNSYSYAFCG